ncbi:MAG TPA: hypothetical protein VFQ68_37205 [Streptosporangiaceae bacterium]|nr:hypothetical protein [Streptosporangiaceae bacterium]
MKTTDPPDIHAAPDELLALARAVRPAWDCDVLAAALLAARQAGWTWDRVLAETVRLMRKADGSPWDLKRAAADPFHRAMVPPGTEKRGATATRLLLGYASCLQPCDPDCEAGPVHCYWIHEPNHKPGWHSQEDCPERAA